MWVAVALAIFIAAGTGAYAWFAAQAVQAGGQLWPWIVAYPVAYALVSLVFTLAWMLFGWLWRVEAPADVAMTPAERARYFVAEWKSISMAPKMIAYALLGRDPRPAPAVLPVLLLHGIGCNAGVWSSMRRYLSREGLGPVYALSYGPPLAAIAAVAPQVAAKIAQIERDTGASQVVIVAHSMGGLVARAYLRQYGPAHVRRLVTVGTPHAGSRHAWLMGGASLVDMRPQSKFVTAMGEPSESERAVPTVSIWSWHDSMVTPQDSSRLAWGENVVVARVAHNALLGDATVQRCVAHEIRKARSQQA
jgi:triacylglycerol esterase/lipase EstA (alpha/beta hydrolase family)